LGSSHVNLVDRYPMASRQQIPSSLAKRFRMKLCLPFLTGAAAGFTAAALPNLNPTSEPALARVAVEDLSQGGNSTEHGPVDRAAVSMGAARTPIHVSPAEARERLARWLAQGAAEEQLPFVHQWLDRWAATDPRAALAFVVGASRFPQRNRAFAIPLAQLCHENSAETILWIQQHLTLDERQEVAQAVVARIAADAPEAALELAFAPDIPVDSHYFAAPLGTLVRANPATALSFFEKLSAIGKCDVVSTMVMNWADVDLDGALRWVESTRVSTFSAEATQTMLHLGLASTPNRFDEMLARLRPSAACLRGLAHRSTDAALQLLPHLDTGDRAAVVQRVLHDQLSRDPDLTLDLAREALPAEGVPSAISNAWQTWMHSDRRAALSWMESVTDQTLQAELRRVVQSNTATDDPRMTLAAFESRSGSSFSSSEAVNAALRLANYDPSTAAQWMSRHASVVPAEALRQVSAEWLGRDPTAATNWAASLPMGAARDIAYETAAEHWIEHDDSEQATQAINSISDPVRATVCRWRAFSQLADRNTASAQAWLERQPPSAEVRESWSMIVESERPPEFVPF
jgi:hypothetical protein